MIVVGLDLSLRKTGMCAVPSEWELDWRRVKIGIAGASLRRDATAAEQAARLRDVRDAVLGFVRDVRPCRVALLDYAYAAHGAHYAGELGGVVKVALLDLGVPFSVVNEARARTMLGKYSRKSGLKIKDWAVTRLVAAGAPCDWPVDCLDAFVAANALLSETGSALVMVDT